MGKKFLEGLAFGAGFAVAFAATAWCVLSLTVGRIYFRAPPPGLAAVDRAAALQAGAASEETATRFDKLPVNEKIKQASIIALARYERSPDGKLKPVFKEFLKKIPGTEFYDVDYSGDDFTKFGGIVEGAGLISFYVGSPAQMRESFTFSGDHLYELGNMPLDVFRQKCRG